MFKKVRVTKSVEKPDQRPVEDSVHELPQELPAVLTVNNGQLDTTHVDLRVSEHIYWGQETFDRVTYTVSVGVTFSVPATPEAQDAASTVAHDWLQRERKRFERQIRDELYPELFHGK